MKNVKTKTRMNNSSTFVQTMAIGAVLTALVVVLQLFASAIPIGKNALSLSQIPIIIGIALCGKYMGAWLGAVFGTVILLAQQAAGYMTLSPEGTIITVMLKGLACGLVAGVVYELLAQKNKYIAVLATAIVCPVVNTGIYLLGCRLFFFDSIRNDTGAPNILAYFLLGSVLINFLLEIGANLVFSPAIVRIIDICKKTIRKNR